MPAQVNAVRCWFRTIASPVDFPGCGLAILMNMYKGANVGAKLMISHVSVSLP